MGEKLGIASGQAMLAAEVVGSGDPVVFLHAAVADSRMWRASLDAVGADNMAIAYDRRGFGETQAKAENFSSVADLMAVLDATANRKPAVLVGCSQGGRVAIDAAFQHPSRVRALVLIAPNVTGAPAPVYSPEIEGLVAQQKEAEKAGDANQLSAIKARLWLDGPLAPDGRVSGVARQLFHDMHGIVLRSPPVGSDSDAWSNFDRLSELSTRSLILWGDLDFPHIQDRCRHLVTALPNSSAHEMANAAHLPSLERPVAIASAVKGFVDSLSKRGG